MKFWSSSLKLFNAEEKKKPSAIYFVITKNITSAEHSPVFPVVRLCRIVWRPTGTSLPVYYTDQMTTRFT